MREQYERFEELVGRVSGGVFQCELCPIYEDCCRLSEDLPPEENFNPEYSCETLMFKYVMTGEKPKYKGVLKNS